ncbi:hypothetical protein [Brevundimonas sp.]|uniref:hypothetical protein n=1 Tax=Brevundimonas sp. TaxID=1871086 RepID=UPI002FC895B7
MRLTPEELAARKRRNLALAGALVAFIVLVFATTVLRMKNNMDQRQAAVAAAGQPVAQGG